MYVRDFVAMQLCFGNELRFTVHHGADDEEYTVRNADRLGELEVESWEVEGGRMHLYAKSGLRVDLVSDELPSGSEFMGAGA